MIIINRSNYNNHFTDVNIVKNFFEAYNGSPYCRVMVETENGIFDTFSLDEYLHVLEFGSLDGFSI